MMRMSEVIGLGIDVRMLVLGLENDAAIATEKFQEAEKAPVRTVLQLRAIGRVSLQ